MQKLIIKRTKNKGKGLFSNSDFKKNTVVIKWRPQNVISKAKVSKLSENEKNHICYIGNGKYAVMGLPERYVNHSCSPNTYVKGMKDVAIRNIKKGEEITTDYSLNNFDNWKMKCGCKSKHCRKTVYGDFRKLSNRLKSKYEPYLQAWFKKELKNK